MFRIDEDKTIHLTRGDAAVIKISANIEGVSYTFKDTDTLRLNVHEKKNCEEVVLVKSTRIREESATVELTLTGEDTRFGECISKPKEYWYEIELNPDTYPQTIIGYDEETGAKRFILYPEGGVV